MIDLGINIKTDEGIAKADGEIKEWVDKLNNELKDKKIKIEFDIPKEIEAYFRDLEEGIDKADNAMKKLNTQSTKLEASLKKTSKGFNDIGKSVNKTEPSINTYRDQLKVLEQEWAKLTATQRKGAEGVQLLRQAKSLNNQYGQYKGTLTQVIAEEKRHEGQMKRSRSTMSSLKGMVMSYISIYSGIRIAKQMAEITGEFEIQKAALGAILQDTERANTLFSQIKTLAVVSPFEVKDLISYTKQLSAFSIPYNELYETTKRLADISAGLGVDMSRLILAYGQVRSAEVLRGQELRQFTEAGIPLIEELRKKFQELGEEGITTADVFDKIYTRQVPFAMVRDVMFEMSDEGGKFFNMQAIQADTLKGKITNLTDAYNIFLSEIGESASPVLKGFIDFLREAMEYHDSLIKAVQWGAGSYAVFRTAIMLANIQLKSLRLTMNTMPWGIIATAITALVYKFSTLAEEAGRVEALYEELSKTLNRHKLELRGEVTALELAFSRLKRAREENENYLEVKKQIVRKYGSYLSGLDEEIEKTGDLNTVLKKVRESMEGVSKARLMRSYMESSEASYVSKSTQSWSKISDTLAEGRFQLNRSQQQYVLNVLSDYYSDMDKVVREGNEGISKTLDYFNQFSYFKENKNIVREELETILGYYKAYKEKESEAFTIFGAPKKGGGGGDKSERSYSIKRNLENRLELQKKLNKLQEKASLGEISKKEFDNIKEYEDGIKKINEELKTLGHVDPKDDKPPKTPAETIKEMLNDIKNEIDEYKQRESIYDILKKQGDDFEMDFKFTVGGEPSIAEFIKKQMGEIGGLGLDLNLDFKTATFEDMMQGVDLSKIYPNEADQKLAKEALESWFQELRRMSMVEYDSIQKVTDTYASYVDKKKELDKKYADEKEKLTSAGADERAFAEQDRVYKEETEKLIVLFASKHESFTKFLEDIAGESLESLTFLMENLEGELLLSDVFGLDENELVVVQGKIAKLREEIKKTKDEIDKANKKTKNGNKDGKNAYAMWKKLETVLSKAQSEFQSLGQTIGGVAGEILSASGDITASTISMISGIGLLTGATAEGVEGTADLAGKSISKVEKASVILAIVSAALQILTKIAGFFIKDTQISQEVIDQYNSLVSVINEVTEAQKEMLDVLSGSEARAQLEESIRLMKKQEKASRDMGKAFVNSGASSGFLGIGSSASEGVKMMERLKAYRKELAKAGINYDALGKRGEKLFDLTAEQIRTMKEEAPEAWAALGSEVQEYLNNIEETQEKLKELENAWRESITGASFDELKSGLDDFLMSADSTFDDVAKNFEDHMLQAMLRVVKAQYLNDAMKKWYENFAKKMDDGVLSKEEREELEQSYIEMAEKAKLMYDTAVDISGLERSASDNLSGLSKGVAEMTEDTALILGGYLDSIRFKLFPYIDFMMTDYSSTIRIISNAQVQQVNHLSEIESNTRISANKVTELTEMIDSVIEIGSSGRKIRV